MERYHERILLSTGIRLLPYGHRSCAELADHAGTITWEIITRIGSRVRRVYV